MSTLKNEIAFAFLSFLLGVILTVFVTQLFGINSNVARAQSFQNRAQINSLGTDPFAQMDRIHEQMQRRMQEAFQSAFSSKGFMLNTDREINSFEYEDSDYKYVEIPVDDLDEENLEVNISQGMISIKAQQVQRHDHQDEKSRSFSSFTSQIQRSFSIPRGVSQESPVITKKDSKIIIKFEKLKT